MLFADAGCPQYVAQLKVKDAIDVLGDLGVPTLIIGRII
jgi:hypothetical protein